VTLTAPFVCVLQADEGSLNAARVIERAKQDLLVDGSSASCDELDKLIAADREAMEFEKEKLDAIGGSDPAQKAKVQATEEKIQSQVNKLKQLRKDKSCASAKANLRKATDADVYKRADEGTLNSARVIERAKRGELVDGSGATCAELNQLISVDQRALKFEKDKLDAMGGTDKAQLKVVEEAEKAIRAQVKSLEAKKAGKC
jgi:CO dehydrogenase/acetyl-CoA synthase epsilon subunit